MSQPGFTERLLLFAREDIQDSVRERQAHLLIAIFALVGGGLAYAGGQTAQRRASRDIGHSVELMPQLLGPLMFLVPLVALGVVAPAIVEKRSTGALTVLLSLPFSRWVVVLGTLIGRLVVITTAALVAIAIAIPIAALFGVSVDPTQVAAGIFAIVLLTVTFTAISVSISAISRTSTRASFAAIFAYVLFILQLWSMIPIYVLSGFQMPETTPTWGEVLSALNPMAAFSNLLAAIPELADIGIHATAENPAIYEQPAVALLILLAWIVLPIGASYLRFRTTDL
ncbi:ABC transporter [Natrialba chahannaoensis JCM 10990]|uniref:ABC transporter n=1 Tax=Natrialba chahannaoensis JCM 10990 TaxID=1227492 RepID=M0AFZ6_9EURY|nr:ABC transporter permease subunit [Natrialba chahannaoensis]ELY97311.1 ABC transporter [Natrialba chahannaoensis JCM 10990]